MKPSIRVEILDHQREVIIHAATIKIFEQVVERGLPVFCEVAISHRVLDKLEELAIAFIDERESARVHVQFMGVAGSTDVITFEHGELLICPAVAQRQAEEHSEPLTRELLRYMVHGLLHLAGYEDDSAEKRKLMEKVQERMVDALWNTTVWE